MSNTHIFGQSSLKILGRGSLETLSLMLNPRKIIPNENGQLRDYRGLAETANLSHIERAKVDQSVDHFRELITIWCRRNEATVLDLYKALESIGRFDVIEDVEELLLSDCNAALRIGLDSCNLATKSKSEEALTIHDMEAINRGEPLVQYDSIILTSDADEDLTFGFHLATRMEAAGLTVFLPQRDLVAGTIEHSAQVDIVNRRCRKAVLVLSPNFFQSSLNKFLSDFILYLSFDTIQKRGMLIPVMFGEECNKKELGHINMLSKLPYDPSRTLGINFYQRLFRIFNINNPSPELYSYPEEIKNLMQGKREKAASHDYSRLTISSTIETTDLNSVANTTVTNLSDTSSDTLARRLPDVCTDPIASRDNSSAELISESKSTSSKRLIRIPLPKPVKKLLKKPKAVES